MAFVDRRLTEDEEKYFLSFKIPYPIGGGNRLIKRGYQWVADDEKKMYLIGIAGQGHLFSTEFPPTWFYFIMDDKLVRIQAYWLREGNREIGWSVKWKLISIVADERLKDRDEELKKNMIEAFRIESTYGGMCEDTDIEFLEIADINYRKGDVFYG